MVIRRHGASLLLALLPLGAACVGESDETLSEDDDVTDETRLRDERVVISQQALGDANLQPKSGTPGDWVVEGDLALLGVFRSKRDNPVLTASIQRRSTQESQVNPAENAAATIRYRLSVTPFPFDEMEPYADANDASGLLYHSIFGTRLIAGQNSSPMLMRDDWDQSAYSEGTTNFRLHPNVKLGRVRVVSFYVSAPHGPIRESMAQYVFDDMRVNDVDVHTTPSENCKTSQTRASTPSPTTSGRSVTSNGGWSATTAARSTRRSTETNLIKQAEAARVRFTSRRARISCRPRRTPALVRPRQATAPSSSLAASTTPRWDARRRRLRLPRQKATTST